jgi:hypothetical protein
VTPPARRDAESPTHSVSGSPANPSHDAICGVPLYPLLRGAVLDNVGSTAVGRGGPPGPNIVKGGTHGERTGERAL